MHVDLTTAPSAAVREFAPAQFRAGPDGRVRGAPMDAGSLMAPGAVAALEYVVITPDWGQEGSSVRKLRATA